MILCALSSFDRRIDLAASVKIFYGGKKDWETKIEGDNEKPDENGCCANVSKMLCKLQTVLTRAFLAKYTLREIKCNFPKMISLVN